MNNEEKNIQAEQPEEVKKPTFADWWKKLATGAKAGIIAALSLIVIVPIVLVIALGGNGDNDGNGDGGDGDKTIEVTVVDTDGNPVEGVEVQFMTAAMPLPQKPKTDANGKVTTDNKDVIKVKVTEIPDDVYTYSKLKEEQEIPSDGKLTITLEKLPEWVVKVVDQDDNGVEGVMVQICDTSCRMAIPTDENGVAIFIEPASDFHALINRIPEGYTEDAESADGFDDVLEKPYYNFDGNTVVIVITKTAE